MTSNTNQIQFPPANLQLVDTNTGLISQQWYYFLLQLFNRVGGASGTPGGAGGSSPIIPVTSFGAVGDGTTDCTKAFQAAFNSTDAVYVPPGEFRITGPIIMQNYQSLIGAGQSSIITQARSTDDVIQVQGQFNLLQSFQTQGGNAGIRFFGANGPCVANAVTDVAIFQAKYGLYLDGYQTPNNPCYWNNFFRVLIEQPSLEGVLLTTSGAGDTPNANKFNAVRVYSHGSPMSGSGFHIQYGRYQNSFIDCEANLYPGATACFRLGANANKNEFINPVAESLGPLPGFWLESGSLDTAIYNFESESAGAAIYDQSGGQYCAYNSGYPTKNTLRKTLISDATLTLQRFNIPFIVGQSQLNVDGTQSYYLLSAFSGNMIVNLPLADTVPGMVLYLKRTDNSTNTITVYENGGNGPGPDSLGFVYMNNQNDWLVMTTNGSTWQITSTNLPLVQNYFVSSAGPLTYIPDMTKDTYLVSANGGNVAFTLPNAHAPGSASKAITIKKTDTSSNTITITEGNYKTFTGTGPDNQTIVLANEYDWIRVMCNGANWFVVAGNLFNKVGIQCAPGFNLDVFGGGYTTAEQAQIARFQGGPTPTAANMYTIGLAKQGTDEIYWGINGNVATNNVPANAVFNSSYGQTSTMVWGRGNSAGNISEASMMLTGAANTAVFTANGVETFLGVGKGLNFNSTADQGIAITTANGLKYLITKILVTNASTSMTTAAGGIYTATSKGGTAVVAATQTYSALTSSTVVESLTLTAAVNASTVTAGELYFSLTTAHGSAATADVYIFGIPLT
jgi:hypothetical protein